MALVELIILDIPDSPDGWFTVRHFNVLEDERHLFLQP
jgi:hypothetical protein